MLPPYARMTRRDEKKRNNGQYCSRCACLHPVFYETGQYSTDQGSRPSRSILGSNSLSARHLRMQPQPRPVQSLHASMMKGRRQCQLALYSAGMGAAHLLPPSKHLPPSLRCATCGLTKKILLYPPLRYLAACVFQSVYRYVGRVRHLLIGYCACHEPRSAHQPHVPFVRSGALTTVQLLRWLRKGGRSLTTAAIAVIMVAIAVMTKDSSDGNEIGVVGGGGETLRRWKVEPASYQCNPPAAPATSSIEAPYHIIAICAVPRCWTRPGPEMQGMKNPLQARSGQGESRRHGVRMDCINSAVLANNEV